MISAIGRMLPVSSDCTGPWPGASAARPASAALAPGSAVTTCRARAANAGAVSFSAAWNSSSCWSRPSIPSCPSSPASASTSLAMARSVRPAMLPGCGSGRPYSAVNTLVYSSLPTPRALTRV